MSTSTALPHVTEKQFQAQVIELLHLTGFRLIYHPWNSQHSAKGWPDVLALRHDYRGVTLAALELKTIRGRISPEQEAWLDGWAQLAVHSGQDVNVVTGLFRPSDFQRLATLLQERQP